MSEADFQYSQLVHDILDYGYSNESEGVRAKWKDGTPAYTLSTIGRKMEFDNSEVPILTSKKVAWKTSIKELLWIWQNKTNVVQDLRDMGVNIWNEWEQEDGTIGRAYGYQLGKLVRKVKISNVFDLVKKGYLSGNIALIDDEHVIIDQVDYLLYQLKCNPSSRRHITTLWNSDDLDEMSLTPCVYETQWHVKERKLHLEVRCRSNDMALGNPFNVYQYNVLQRMIAQVTGYGLGEYHYHIGDAHIYDRHVDALTKQISSKSYKAPQLWINPEIKNFYDFSIDDFKLIGYNHGETIKFEVAV